MAWPEGTPAWLKRAYGVVQAGVNINMSTADLIDSLRPYAEAAPGGFGPKGAAIVSQVRAMAARMREAREAVNRAGLTGPLQAGHVALAPWARDNLQRSLVPGYQVRALVSYANPAAQLSAEGEPDTLQRWVTARFESLPTTLGTLTGYVANAIDESGSLDEPIDTVDEMEIIEV